MRALTFTEKLDFDPAYPDPQPAGTEILVNVTRAGICNTDLEIMGGYMGFQGVLGHEFAGITADGRRVAGEINVSCRNCETCQRGMPTQCPHRTTVGIDRHDGAFADNIILPPENLHTLPDEISDDQAVFIEPLAAGLQTLAMTHIRPDHRVVLVGAGKLGLLTAQVIALTGCSLTVIARHNRQFELLRSWNLESAKADEVETRQADIVVDCTGNEEGFVLALDLVKPRGIIHLKSTYHDLPQVNLTRAVVDEIRIETSRCGPFPAAIRLLKNGLVDVDSLIDARYPLDDGLKAMQHAAQKGTLKILLDIQ